MEPKTPAKKKPSSPKETCTRPGCHHPKPFHKPDGCWAFACSCEGFTKSKSAKASPEKTG